MELSQPRNDNADGFGGEVIRELAPFLAKNGTLCWITTRGALITSAPQKTFSALQQCGLHKIGVIDFAPSVFPGTNIEGAVVVLRYEQPAKNFVGALRDTQTADAMAQALLSGPAKKGGPSWIWLEAEAHAAWPSRSKVASFDARA